MRITIPSIMSTIIILLLRRILLQANATELLSDMEGTSQADYYANHGEEETSYA